MQDICFPIAEGVKLKIEIEDEREEMLKRQVEFFKAMNKELRKDKSEEAVIPIPSKESTPLKQEACVPLKNGENIMVELCDDGSAEKLDEIISLLRNIKELMRKQMDDVYQVSVGEQDIKINIDDWKGTAAGPYVKNL